MTVEELRRLLIAPEIIVVDITDAALVALERALLVEHPTISGVPAVDDSDVRRHAAVILRSAARLHTALRAYRAAVNRVLDDSDVDDLPF